MRQPLEAEQKLKAAVLVYISVLACSVMNEDDNRDKATEDAGAPANGTAASIEEIMRVYDSLRAEFGAIAELMRKLTTPARD